MAQKQVVSIEGMMCEGCARRVTAALKSFAGSEGR
jgi:copper chaperone CopZ